MPGGPRSRTEDKTIRPGPRTPRRATPRSIYDYLDRFVIGQERAKRAVAAAAYNHVKRCDARAAGEDTLLRKSNILMIGPTGCGKTHLARNLADCLEVPFTIADATEYTEAGYYGKDVEVMVAELLFKTEHDVEAAQQGIIFVDEIDKIARRSHGARTGAGSRDIGGEGVQQSLLKLLEGRQIFVPLNVTQHWSKHDFVPMDTTDILFICAGTFSDIHLYANASTPMGFASAAPGDPGMRITHKDLMDYGLIAEILGRLPVSVQLSELDDRQLRAILTEPPDAVIREYTELLERDGVELRITDDGLDEIVAWSIRKRLGARGLRSIVEEVLADVVFDAPESKQKRVTVNKKFVTSRLENAPLLLD
jgi:ATP-dependent Clp protease ATP-binding subunit ClpX